MRQVYTAVQKCSRNESIAAWCAVRLQARSLELLQRRGGKMVVYANDFIGNVINAHGFYEFSELAAIFEFLRPLYKEFRESIALDIGANIGNHSIYFSRYFQWVHAFEPHPITRKILEINAGFYSNISVHGYGLGDCDGELTLKENPTNLGGSRIVASGQGDYLIQLRRLDDAALERSKIALIKLDVEGHEAQVLRGGMETIKQAKPLILFEAHAEDFDGPMEEIDLLKAMGYAFVWLQPLGTGVKKYMRWIVQVLTGKKKRILCTGDAIPRADHGMIIAVPPRWMAMLGLR